MVKVKICGITNLDDALEAVRAGADALGFVFYQGSPRAVDPGTVREIIAHVAPFVATIGVFVNERQPVIREIMDACGVSMAQLHGDEKPDDCLAVGRPVLKGVHIRDQRDLAVMGTYSVRGFVLDAYVPGMRGGTGKTIDWYLAKDAKRYGPILLAGGLSADNVGEAIERVRPYGVDVSSGIESAPGKKDHEKLRRFIRTAQSVGT